MPAQPATSAVDPTCPFTYSAGLASGLTPGTLRGPRFRRILYGVYVQADAPRRPLERVTAALLLHPDRSFASHTSAARVYDLPVPRHLTDEHVTVMAPELRRAVRGVRSHVASGPGATVRLRGFRVSAPTQLFLEMATLLDLVDLVVLGDALVRSRRAAPQELVQAAAVHAGRHARLARRAASHVRAGVDSPMETRLRMLLVLAGLPEPEVNHEVYDSHGRLLLRFDLCYPAWRLIVEFDGRQHRADLDQWDRDQERDDYFDEHGWRIVRVFSRGIYREPEKTVLRVHRALVAQGYPRLRRPGEEWRRHFPT